MNKLTFKTLDFFLEDTPIKTTILNNILPLIVPFNIGHKITVQSHNKEQVLASLPNIKRNHNHIGTIHACAIATLGEFCAGILLLHHFSLHEYRMIMTQLDVTFKRQGKSKLRGEALLPILQQYQIELHENGVTLIPMETKIFDQNDELIAVVKTTWQFKQWQKTHNC